MTGDEQAQMRMRLVRRNVDEMIHRIASGVRVERQHAIAALTEALCQILQVAATKEHCALMIDGFPVGAQVELGGVHGDATRFEAVHGA